MVRPFVLMGSRINSERDGNNVSEDERSDRDNKCESDPIPYQFIDFTFILKRLAEVTANKTTYPDEIAFP